MADDAVTSAKIADATIVAANIGAGEVGTAELAADAVTTAKITDATIVAADIATGAVTTGEILDGTTATADLANDAVTSGKIVDATVAAGDMAAGAVVLTVNGLTYAVTLDAGTNMVITPSGNMLPFDATDTNTDIQNTLDGAYDEGGAGAGRTITADNGAVDIAGAGGLTMNGSVSIGTTTPGSLLHVEGSDTSGPDGILSVKNTKAANTGFRLTRPGDPR